MKNRFFNNILLIFVLLITSQVSAMEIDFSKTLPKDIQFLPEVLLGDSEMQELNAMLQKVVKPDSWEDTTEWQKKVDDVSRELKSLAASVPQPLKLTFKRVLGVLKDLEQIVCGNDDRDLMVSPREGQSVSIQSFDGAIADMLVDPPMNNVMDGAKSFPGLIDDLIAHFDHCTLDDPSDQCSKSCGY